ncbi:retropepsin-like aspartic protease [Silvibacterium acidisoli]|uniref:retropepsin-like aspartic protease n=1 Tax=Acidobacteriaceae bacterium ZG23-2 TaxID=2883246 RepID=UPI00406C9CA4
MLSLPLCAAAFGQAQVVTGASASDIAHIPTSQLVAEHDWVSLATRLQDDHSPDTALYRGILFNKQGKYLDSLHLLEPLLPAIVSGSDRTKEKQARLALAGDYLATFRYQDAASQYAAIEQCCAQSLTASERDEVEPAAHLLPLLATAPAQTLETSGSFTLPMARNALGLREVEVFVDGFGSHWLFDPAAAFTMLSRSQAKRIGLHLSDQTVTIDGLTGRKMLVHTTVIPQLKFGQAFFRNVPAVIYEDQDLYDRAHSYQVEGVLAQPLLAPLGAVKASDDEHLTISNGPELTGGVPFFRDGIHLVAAGGAGAREPYVVDPGTGTSLLSSRYFDANRETLTSQKTEDLPVGENGGAVPACTPESVRIALGSDAIELHEIPVLTRPAGAEQDRFYGRLGEDALDQLESFTFDFRSNRFVVNTRQ